MRSTNIERPFEDCIWDKRQYRRPLVDIFVQRPEFYRFYIAYHGPSVDCVRLFGDQFIKLHHGETCLWILSHLKYSYVWLVYKNIVDQYEDINVTYTYRQALILDAYYILCFFHKWSMFMSWHLRILFFRIIFTWTTILNELLLQDHGNSFERSFVFFHYKYLCKLVKKTWHSRMFHFPIQIYFLF